MNTVVEEGPRTFHVSTRARPSYSDLADRIDQIEKLGKWIAMSKMFGCDTVEQACVIAADCFLTGMTLLEYQRRNKIVNGRPFKQYDAMLAEFHERGGKSKIIESTPETACVEFTFEGSTNRMSLTWQELQREPIPYLGKESEVIAALEEGKPVKLKPKYATPRSRQTMLMARLVSASIRVICPEVNYGTYTEEEFDYVDAESVVTVAPARDETKRRIAESKKAVEPVVEQPKQDPEYIVCSQDDRERVERLLQSTKDKQDSAPMQLETPAAGIDNEAMQTAISSPSLSTQIDEIKSLMAEIKNAGDSEIAAKVKAKLKASDMERLSELSIYEADLLIKALASKNVSLWLDASLVGVVPF
jgi:hypothetical protein